MVKVVMVEMVKAAILEVGAEELVQLVTVHKMVVTVYKVTLQVRIFIMQVAAAAGISAAVEV
jgi:hypothetical protein